MWLNTVPTWMDEKRFSTTTLREGGRRMRFSRARARVFLGKEKKHRSSALFFRSVGEQKEEESKEFCCCFGIFGGGCVGRGGGRDGERS
jgi:hypothetical protein